MRERRVMHINVLLSIIIYIYKRIRNKSFEICVCVIHTDYLCETKSTYHSLMTVQIFWYQIIAYLRLLELRNSS